VTNDSVEAVNWYRKAAAQGVAVAQYELGLCYSKGEGVTKDAVEAAKWYRKAAEQRFAPAQYKLGMCYYDGFGVIKDAVEAVKWSRKAAEQGFAEAQLELGLFYHSGEGVTKDVVEAAKWFRKAAEQGVAVAQFDLGSCYADGDGVPKNVVEAVKWFHKAAEFGFAPAKLEMLPAKASASSNRPDLEILSLTTKVMETNNTWWRWSYQLKVRNKTDQPIHEFPYLRFLDAEGFIIQETICEVKLSARETKTVLGTDLVDLPGAARVKTVKVE
jgi:TPR repeat protein